MLSEYKWSNVQKHNDPCVKNRDHLDVFVCVPLLLRGGHENTIMLLQQCAVDFNSNNLTDSFLFDTNELTYIDSKRYFSGCQNTT